MKFHTIIIIITTFISTFMLQAQDLNWGYVVGNSGAEKTNDVAIDTKNNVISVGEFNGTFDIDPSSNILNLSSAVREGFITKYNQKGDLLWLIEFNADISGNSSVLAVETDNNDNIYALLSPYLNVDIDPSSNVVNVSDADGPLVLIKYDKNGNYISHVGSIHTTGGTYPTMTIDKNNNLYVFSGFSGSIDIDPTASTQTLVSNGAIDWFISKYNSNLNFDFAFSIGGANNEYGNSIYVDSLLNIYIVGSYESTVDFDPGIAVNSVTATNSYDAYLAKYNSSGQLQFVKSFSGTNNQEIFDVKVYNNKIYVCGNFEVDIDTDPGAGVRQFTMGGILVGKDAWFGRYSLTDGSLEDSWHITGDGTYPNNAKKIRFDEWGNIYLGLVTWGWNNYDVKGGVYNINSSLYDIGFAKYTSNGDLVWAGIMLGGEIDGIANMDIDTDYNLIVGGNIRVNSVNINIAGGSDNRAGIANDNILLVSYNLNVPPKVEFSKIYTSTTSNIDGRAYLKSNGNSNMKSLGVIASESATPNLINASVIVSKHKDSTDFYFNLENLYSATDYYIRTFGINETDTGYGEIYIIKTKPTAEDLGPNNGDANGDGIKDSRQSFVHTFKSINEHYVTLVSNSESLIYDVRNRKVTTDKYYFPYQMFEFKINSKKDTVKIYFHNSLLDTNAKYIKINRDNILYNYPILNRGIDTIGTEIVSFIELELIDGGAGDYDGVANGIIHDPGGPALPVIVSNIPTLPNVFKIILLTLLLAFGLRNVLRYT